MPKINLNIILPCLGTSTDLIIDNFQPKIYRHF